MRDGNPDLERRLQEHLHRRGATVRPSLDAYGEVLSGISRQRRRHRRRRVAASAATVVVLVVAVPLAVRSVLDNDPAGQVVAEPVLPRLRPATTPMGFAVSEVRDLTDAVPTSARTTYVQVFERRGSLDDRLVARQVPGGAGLSNVELTETRGDSPVPVEVDGVEGYLRASADRVSLTWFDPDAEMQRELHARGLAVPEVLQVANGWQERAGGPGIDPSVLPDDLSLVSEGAIGSTGDDRDRTELTYAAGPGGNGRVDLVIRRGSPLELELVAAVAADVERVRIERGDAVLVSDPSDEGEVLTLTWAEPGDMIVEVSGRGVERATLLGFADSLREVDEQAWESFLATVEEQATVVRGVEVAPEPTLAPAPGSALQGVVGGELWRVAWNDSGRGTQRCVEVTVESTVSRACASPVSDAVAGAAPRPLLVSHPVGDRWLVALHAPGRPELELVIPEQFSVVPDGQLGSMRVLWFLGEPPESLAVRDANGEIDELAVTPALRVDHSALPPRPDELAPEVPSLGMGMTNPAMGGRR